MTGFVPPPYPYDRLKPLEAKARAVPGGTIDLSIGTPCDPPPALVHEALSDPDAVRAYPPSVGTAAYREAVVGWLERRFDVRVAPTQVAACVGSKELVAGMPQWLRLRTPERDTVLYPAISYPTYAMGATLAGCRAVPVPVDDAWRLRLEAIDPADAARALCLWVNTPGNPAGGLDDLGAAAAWGRTHGVPVLSDECYAEFTWDGPSRSILQHGTDGVLAVHSLSKRSNFAGARIGFYAGDAELVGYLSEVRKHAGFMPPGPVQLAGALAWRDHRHVAEQVERYRERLELLIEAFARIGLEAPMPAGAFYLWVPAPDGDAWALAERLAVEGGALVSPGEFYGEAGAGHVRVAAVQPTERIRLLVDRLG
ncbi:aminotransferase class I/II-fold pyridoxal phosphate-dependent enzyme [Aquihabitans sp. G128]|uniref:pyridoxal phosphate-dependent aminotransferase n=1 Tax=Aquihabitans sp. G128 TaxID=2849779 RepID=UPI001C22DA9D|nr:pyridoxal phosphate-dependent aminotransferase [Aquihabitans sp. G128]QXC62497.1 aminotransferase class I/II-fold pyridoxal phosphate-dependent enzyme [Aquihabitans sp. G128]